MWEPIWQRCNRGPALTLAGLWAYDAHVVTQTYKRVYDMKHVSGIKKDFAGTARVLFDGVTLPVRPAMAADGARIVLIDEAPAAVAHEKKPFFGGYAEDMLSDIGFDFVEEMPESGRIKRV